MIKAIETHYKGCRFRSRLEARWAVFFEAAGIEWLYEPEGFERDGEKYLPDFYLPGTATWVEVKGDKDSLKKNWRYWSDLLDWGGCLPGFNGCAGTNVGLVLLGEIPHIGDEQWGIQLHPIIQHHEGLQRNWVFFKTSGCKVLDLGEFSRIFGVDTEFGLEGSNSDGWLVDSKFMPTVLAHKKILDAYRTARGARFEHGETPA